MRTFITRSQLAARLCIHCTHCQTSYPTLCASSPRHMCDLKRDAADGTPALAAAQARASLFVCGGRKWAVKPDLVICETEAQADDARREDWVQTFIPIAREHVRDGVTPMATCGGYEEARRRVEAEQEVTA